MNKTEAKTILLPILEKGKSINDIIFISKKMTKLDISLMLLFLRPTWKPRVKVPWFGKRIKSSMEDEGLNNMLNTPMFGGDGIQQLVFGCISALDVYTEAEILTVLAMQEKFAE